MTRMVGRRPPVAPRRRVGSATNGPGLEQRQQLRRQHVERRADRELLDHATLWAGNPTFDAPDPSTRPTDGRHPRGPAVPVGQLTFVGNTLFTRDTGEIWYVDTSTASPVEKHLIGRTRDETNPGSSAPATRRCSAPSGHGRLEGWLARRPGRVGERRHSHQDPQGAGCTVESWAGTKDDVTFTGTNYPNLGDIDGPLGTSKIGYPTAVATDGTDTVYFYDGQAQVQEDRQ